MEITFKKPSLEIRWIVFRRSLNFRALFAKTFSIKVPVEHEPLVRSHMIPAVRPFIALWLVIFLFVHKASSFSLFNCLHIVLELLAEVNHGHNVRFHYPFPVAVVFLSPKIEFVR